MFEDEPAGWVGVVCQAGVEVDKVGAMSVVAGTAETVVGIGGSGVCAVGRLVESGGFMTAGKAKGGNGFRGLKGFPDMTHTIAPMISVPANASSARKFQSWSDFLRRLSRFTGMLHRKF